MRLSNRIPSLDRELFAAVVGTPARTAILGELNLNYLPKMFMMVGTHYNARYKFTGECGDVGTYILDDEPLPGWGPVLIMKHDYENYGACDCCGDEQVLLTRARDAHDEDLRFCVACQNDDGQGW